MGPGTRLCIAAPVSPPLCSRTSPNAVSTTTRSSSVRSQPATEQMRSTRWRPPTRPRPSIASPPGCTRTTVRCSTSSSGAATRIDTATRAMGMVLGETRLPRSPIELAPPDWREHLRIAEVPAGLPRSRRPHRLPRRRRTARRRERRHGPRLRARRRLRHLQRRHARTRPPPRAGNRRHRDAPA